VGGRSQVPEQQFRLQADHSRQPGPERDRVFVAFTRRWPHLLGHTPHTTRERLGAGARLQRDPGGHGQRGPSERDDHLRVQPRGRARGQPRSDGDGTSATTFRGRTRASSVLAAASRSSLLAPATSGAPSACSMATPGS
jgi:hypothetical protein